MDQDHTQSKLHCPHCGNTSLQSVIHRQRLMETLYTVPDGKETQESAHHTVVVCQTCEGVLVYHYLDNEKPYLDTPFGDLVYPAPGRFSEGVPRSLSRIYDEALKVKFLSPTSFVILVRRLLEEICVDKLEVTKGLAADLRELAERGLIPEPLAEASSLIRLVGNAGAHASELQINTLHAMAVDDFIRAMIEYLYVAPAKIADFKETFREFELQA